MSNHVATITKDEGRCSFSRKALSVFMAVLLAFLMMPMVPAESALANQVTAENIKSVTVDQKGWTQASTTAQTITVKVELKSPVTNENGDTLAVTLNKDGKAIGSGVADTVSIGKGASSGTVDLTVPQGKAAAGTYTIVDTAASTTVYYTFSISAAPMTGKEAFEAGVATAGVDQDNTALEPNEKGEFALKADGANFRYVVPTKVKPAGTDQEVDVVLDGKIPAANDSTGSAFFSNAEGTTPVSLNELKTPGTYYAKVKPADDETAYAGGALCVKFTVEPSSLDGAQAYVVNGKDAADYSQTEIVYDGADYAKRIGFVLGGKAVQTKSATFYNSLGQQQTSVKDAGSYTAVIEGADGTVYAGEKATVKFEVKQLDLATADLAVNDVEVGTSAYGNILAGAEVNGKALGDGNTNTVAIDGVQFAAGPVVEKGSYDATFSAATNQQNVVGSKTVKFAAVGELVKDFKYNGAALSSIDNTTFGVSGSSAFDIDLVTVEDNEGEMEASEYEVKLVNASGAEVKDASAPGSYTLTVTVPTGDSYAQGGKASVKFNVSNGTFVNAETVVTYKGDVFGSQKIVYDGTDVLDDFAVTVKVGNKTLAEGTDFTVSATRGGEAVDEAVEAGADYALTIKGVTYQGTITVPFAISKAQITNLRVQTDATKVLPWTGEAVTPVVEFTTDGEWVETDAKTGTYAYVAPEDATWQVLPADQFNASYAKDGKAIEASEVVDEGQYEVTVTPNTKMANYGIADVASLTGTMKTPVQTALEFKVSKVATFADVSTDAWYASEVAKAADLEYIDGVGNNLFMPDAKMTREQFAQILANMAGEKGEAGTSYPTRFADVDPAGWSAFAIMWATNAGIVNGTSADAFSPFADVTREQIATMLYRYAGNGAQADASALDDFADGDQVSAWAQNAVAWAVENGYLKGNGEGLDPQGTATRAEVAALAVRVQPDGVPTV